ncbi:MAG: DUF3179 domain-containing (seleno)protein [Gammaproteobacteria bacterium]
MTAGIVFWLLMIVAQAGAFLLFKDLADISQWLVQSSRVFTMRVWYNRHLITGVSTAALLFALVTWVLQPDVAPGPLVALLVFLFLFNSYSGLLNPKWMFRSQQHQARFVSVEKAPVYMQRSLHLAHFGPASYDSVDDINVLVLETDNGAYAYSDYYLLQPHVVKGDTIDGEDVIMTYCGLTNLGIAYTPRIGDRDLDLTVMTQLKNNLVMFDKNSGEPIQQLWGNMERKQFAGKMKEWATIRMPFASFRQLYPDGKVFINEIAGFSERPLLSLWDRLVRHVMMLWGVGLNWVDNEKPAFPTVEYKDKRLPMKELVYAISINDDHVVYSKDFVIGQGGLINVEIGGQPVVVYYDTEFDSLAAFYNTTGSRVERIDILGRLADGGKLQRVNTLKSRIFWFIFVEFFPQTDINRI